MEPDPSVSCSAGSSTEKQGKNMVASSACAYRDHSHITDDDKELNALMDKADAEGVKGTDQTFPVKLHQLLSGSDEDGFSHIVCWQDHGRSFIVKKHTEFVEKVLPCCFRQSKFASFQRQLNLYGFRRITQGRDKGGYYHELFLRGRTLLALKMQRTKVKGTGARKASSPETEPNFYSMRWVEDRKKKPSTSLSTPAAAFSVPAPIVAMSPLSAQPAPPATMSPLVPSPLLATRSLTSAALAKVSPPSYGARKLETNAFSRGVAFLGLDKSANAHLSMGSIPLLPASQLPPTSARPLLPQPRLEVMSQLLAAHARLNKLRNAPSLGVGSLPLPSTRQCGPIHLNALNMPCNCATPVF